MHPSAWNFTAGSIGCVYQVSWHKMAMSLSCEGSSDGDQVEFFTDFSTKKCAAWNQRAKDKNITIWVMLPKLNSYVEK